MKNMNHCKSFNTQNWILWNKLKIYKLFSFFIFIPLLSNSQDIILCPNDTAYLDLTVYTGSLQWQESVDSTTWVDISGATYQPCPVVAIVTKYYRAKINSGTCNSVFSIVKKVTRIGVPIITTQPVNRSLCAGINTSFSVTASGENLIYQWQVSFDDGISFTNISSAGSNPVYTDWTSSTLSVSGTIITNNGLKYRCLVTGTCAFATTSNAAALIILDVLPPVAVEASSVGRYQFSANWNVSAGATGYSLDISTDSSFSSFVSPFNNYNVGNVTTFSTYPTIFKLIIDTKYYYRVRASNTCGISENFNIISCRTLNACLNNTTITDARDGKVYNVVALSEKCWMKQNLNVGTFVSSNNTGGSHSDVSNNGIIEKYCYNNNVLYCDTFGGFYDWNEAVGYGIGHICPNGSHIPTNGDWDDLEHFIDPTVPYNTPGWRGTDVGTKLKTGGSSGFEILIAGARDLNGGFDLTGTSNSLWSAQESWPWGVIGRHFIPSSAQVEFIYLDKNYGLSIRCVIDY